MGKFSRVNWASVAAALLAASAIAYSLLEPSASSQMLVVAVSAVAVAVLSLRE